MLTTNGVPLVQLPDVALTDSGTSAFGDQDDFRVDTLCIASYSSSGDDYDSVLAHGTVDNIAVTWTPSIQDLSGGFTNQVWQAQFLSRSNWMYALERTTDLESWTDVSPATPGNGADLFLQDTNLPLGQAFYRVRANRP